MKKLISILTICLFAVTANAQKNTEKVYGDNLIAVSPFIGYASSQLSDLAVGISYERFLNDNISAKIPLNVGLSTNMFQTGVGLKFYPSGHRRLVKYAVGPTLLFARSSDTYEVSRFDNNGMFLYQEEVKNPLTQVGFMLTNSLNITVQKNIYMGIEMGFGSTI